MLNSTEERKKVLQNLVSLAHFLGKDTHQLVIQDEGNVSAMIPTEKQTKTFLISADHANLNTIEEKSFVLINQKLVLKVLSEKNPSDSLMEKVLTEAKMEPHSDIQPSLETFLHAVCLNVKDIHFVAHTHPVPVAVLTCSSDFPENLRGRIYPDEIIALGNDSVFVPYTRPGVNLAQRLKLSIADFRQKYQHSPRIAYLQNHGMIAMGSSAEEVIHITLMATKAAAIRVGALSLGNLHHLSRDETDLITRRERKPFQ